MNIMKKLKLKYNTMLMKRRIKELERQRQPLIDLKNKYLTELRCKNLEIGRLKKKIKYLESEEYIKDIIFKNALNRDFDGFEILGDKENERN